MDMSLRIRLSIMMLIQFFVWGTWNVTAPSYLQTIGFNEKHIGLMYAVGPIAGMISPFFIGMIADRFFPAQRVLAVLHLVGAGLMLMATVLMKQGFSPLIIVGMIFIYMLTYFPTLAVTNTLALRNMSNPEKEFPGIRVMGTIGWIVATNSLSLLKIDTSIDMFYLSAGAAVVLGIYSFFLLPHTPPTATGKASVRDILGLDALSILKDRSYVIFLFCSTLICIPLSFYYQLVGRLLQMANMPIGRTSSFGQISEIVFMLIMPIFFARLGVKKMLAVGMVAWVIRYTLFAFGAPSQISFMILLGIVMHGICYDFFFVTGQIYTDQAAPAHLRGQAQGLLVLFTLGLGMALGALFTGYVEAWCTPEASRQASEKVSQLTVQINKIKDTGGPSAEISKLEIEQKDLQLEALKLKDWEWIWAIPAFLSAAIFLFFMITFKEPTNRSTNRVVTDIPTGEIV